MSQEISRFLTFSDCYGFFAGINFKQEKKHVKPSQPIFFHSSHATSGIHPAKSEPQPPTTLQQVKGSTPVMALL